MLTYNPSPFSEHIKELPLSYVTWWFCNEIEGSALFGSQDPAEIAENFSQQFPNSNLILTLGNRGSLFKNADTLLTQKIYPAKAIDTTAAGDTFTGYFIAAIAAGKQPAEALDLASKASSITVFRMGAASSIPYMHEINGKMCL